VLGLTKQNGKKWLPELTNSKAESKKFKAII